MVAGGNRITLNYFHPADDGVPAQTACLNGAAVVGAFDLVGHTPPFLDGDNPQDRKGSINDPFFEHAGVAYALIWEIPPGAIPATVG
jgi:hypothetical protein